jgi:hypothetical protein
MRLARVRGGLPQPTNALQAGLWRPGRLPYGNVHPGLVQAFIIQNPIIHEDGLGPLWLKRRELSAERAANAAGIPAYLSSLAATKQGHVGSNS